MPRARTRSALVAALTTLLGGAPALAQLTDAQEKCVNKINKGMEKVSKTVGKESLRCIRDFNDGDIVDIPQCVADDVRGKIAKAGVVTSKAEDKSCLGDDNDGIPRRPGVFYTPAEAVNTVATAGSRIHLALYGSIDAANAITEATNAAASRCQEKIGKRLQRCQRARIGEFNKCKKSSLKVGTDTPAALASCITEDSRSKIAKSCDLNSGGKVDGIRRDLDTQCISKGVDLALAFPHCGSSDLEAVHACLATGMACLSCTILNQVDGLETDCDILDNGGNDNSCPDCSFLGTCTLTETSVSPAATDPAIDDPVGGNHLVYVNQGLTQNDEILVHLPGTFGTPAGNSRFLQAVANQGTKAIGLQYVNDGTVNGICFNEWTNNPPPDPDCQEKLRLERIYGTDTSPLESVSPANSLVHRLVKLLEYLHAQQPSVGWDTYLDSGQPDWDRIAFSGHSQGSGMAALLARDHAVARVLMFGGPSDFNPLGETADWMTDPKATSINDHYGFRHVDDQQFPVMQTWADMGLPGPSVIVNDSNPPFLGSHFLETDISVPSGAEHSSVIRNTQLEQGDAPTFRDVWEYMCCSP